MSGKFFGMSGKFGMSGDDLPPVGNISGKKCLGALFNRKCPSMHALPQLLDASYAPDHVWVRT
jgi:hypothetical protein